MYTHQLTVCNFLPQGLMPLFISPRSGNFTARRVSFGALGDSYYEVRRCLSGSWIAHKW